MFLCGCVGSLGDWPQKATEAERGPCRPMYKHSKQSPKQPTHTHKNTHRHIQQATDHSPKQPPHTHKTHTNTLHKLGSFEAQRITVYPVGGWGLHLTGPKPPLTCSCIYVQRGPERPRDDHISPENDKRNRERVVCALFR